MMEIYYLEKSNKKIELRCDLMKEKIDAELLKKVAANARLELSEAELKKFLPQLQEILDVFSKLDEVNTDKTKPSFQPIAMKNIWREDKAGKGLLVGDALANTRLKEKNYFKGPRIV